jgi:ubiquinone/menaquinone biosynthesis C-methylase UbiE
MLNCAKARFPGAGFILGSAYSLPLRDACVEVSVFSYSLSVLAKPVEAVQEALRVSSKVIVLEYDKPSFVPGFLWQKVVGRFGWKVYGSTNIDFETIESLAGKKIARSFCGRLYRVVVLEGAKHA